MLFTTISAILATAVAASASPLEARQVAPWGPGFIRATYFNDGGCGPSPWAEDEVFMQNTTRGVAGCHDLDVGPFQSTYFNQSTLTLPIRFFNVPCSQVTQVDNPGSQWVTISPSDGPTPGCRSLAIRSYITL